tara:strand:+ start:559 stop:735 length:177 start_codon:yes stop_codon:yes gene_type:complete
MSISMYIVGVGIFVVYMFLLVRMINTQHKIQERELQQNKVVKRKVKSKNKKIKHGVKL